jgi:cell division protease FtsH
MSTLARSRLRCAKRPDRSGRLEILKVHLAKIRLVSGLDLDQVAGLTTGFTGADVANLVNEAAIVATRRGAEAVTLADFTAAIERIVAGLEKKSRVLGEEERRRGVIKGDRNAAVFFSN